MSGLDEEDLYASDYVMECFRVRTFMKFCKRLGIGRGYPDEMRWRYSYTVTPIYKDDVYVDKK